MHILLIAAMLLLWGLAAAAWPDLPERLPVHFDIFDRRVDRWAETTWWEWFHKPVLGTSIAAVLGFLLPRWMVALARRNSRWLKVPGMAQFAALPVAARERVVRASVPRLHAALSCWQGLLSYCVFGSARVADGRWGELPPVPLFALMALMLVCVVGLAIASARAVRREVALAKP
jgi:Protein of unknown function (DUF1648)